MCFSRHVVTERLLINHHGEPRKIVTDKLRSYDVAQSIGSINPVLVGIRVYWVLGLS